MLLEMLVLRQDKVHTPYPRVGMSNPEFIRRLELIVMAAIVLLDVGELSVIAIIYTVAECGV